MTIINIHTYVHTHTLYTHMVDVYIYIYIYIYIIANDKYENDKNQFIHKTKEILHLCNEYGIDIHIYT